MFVHFIGIFSCKNFFNIIGESAFKAKYMEKDSHNKYISRKRIIIGNILFWSNIDLGFGADIL
jgi:hypothetical protein